MPTDNKMDESPTTTDKPLLNRDTLKSLAIKGSIWVMIGFVVGQLLRLVGNVVLTRLLSPEMFGMMGMVGALLTGLAMFSDIGLRPNIIQSKRGEDPDFLRTAWSIQVVRGLVLTLFAALFAWPLSIFNDEPRLFLIGMVLGLSPAISGFNSISLLVHSRRMFLGKLVLLNIFNGIVVLIVKVVWAWYSPTVWALVVGTFVGSFLTLIISHTILATIPMRFQWELESVREFVRFGRWMFISTALSFLAGRLDVLILGRMGGMEMLGFYILAKNLAMVVTQALRRLSSMILLPVYSRLAERNIHMLRRRTLKIRSILLIVFIPPLWILILGGEFIIDLLYDERYQQAGWMLQVLASGSVALVIRVTIGPILLSVGDSFRHMIDTAVRVGLQIICIATGIWFAGTPGLLVGLGVAEWLSYVMLIYLIRPYGVWLPLLDMTAFGSSLVVIGITFLVLN